MNSPRKLLLSGALAGTALVGGALIANLANAARRMDRRSVRHHGDDRRPQPVRYWLRHVRLLRDRDAGTGRQRQRHARPEQGRPPGQRQDRDRPHG